MVQVENCIIHATFQRHLLYPYLYILVVDALEPDTLYAS